MILAGVDEAGYGPLLGPLVVGCCAFEVDDEAGEAAGAGAGGVPCLWTPLKKVVSKSRVRGGKKLHVNDSKQVYSPAGGLKELERSILALAGAWRDCGEGLAGLLGQVAGHVLADLPDYPWYAPPEGECFPLEQEAVSVRMFANALKAEMLRTRTGCVYLGARVVLERQFNRLCDQTRNKSNALFSTAAIHIDYLLRTYGERGLTVFCDRQGGRAHYGHLLRLMFEEWSLEIVSQTEARSEYRLLRDGHAARIIFCEKAEAQCLSVAVASMLSKYLREALMRRFNAYWHAALPGVAPTAGYYSDGLRFLQDIEAKRSELGVRDEELIRSR